ncbi:MAG TPA: peptidylprolyl isomerase [Bdellovibrionales bacterium]|jgi:peptidyl-prolyl cis-trans isomerase C/peptidyl-prolyl cis-trans isomerase D|nr:peptidylprolyl isomerase [Bdellovibrionales bacterium]
MMRNIVLGMITVVLLVPVLANAQGKDKEVVATVGTKQITMKEFNEKYNEVLKQTINPPNKELFLEDLVRYEMGVQEAIKKGMQDDPMVKERVRQEYYKGLVEKELGKKVSEIKVNEKEMQEYYKNNPEIRTSHILIEYAPDATEAQKTAAKKRADEIYSEVKKSKRPFEELVGLYTDDALSKRTGGDVGWQSRLTLVPTYYDAALKMKVGEVRGLIETQYGYHIIKVTARRGYADANKSQIRAAVFDQKRKQLFDGYFARLKNQYPVKVNKSLIR